MKGRWIYLLLDAEIKAVGLKEVEMYILRLHNTVFQYITTDMILELCMMVERCPGSQV